MTLPPQERKVDAVDIRSRLSQANTDGLPRGELDVLAADAANFIKAEIQRERDTFAQGLVRGFNVDTLINDAITAVSHPESELWRCEPSTILGGIMNAGQMGLRIGVGGQSWLLPFWSASDQIMKAQIMIGYQGWVNLCYRSGQVVDVASEVVYQKEFEAGKFKFWRTEERPHLHHEPDLTISSVKEPIFAFYATARTKGKGFFVTRPWSLGMMEEHRDTFAMRGRNGSHGWFWVRHFAKAGKKTMVRELTSLMPKSFELEQAFATDGGVRNTYSPNVAPGEATAHEKPHIVISADQIEASTTHPADM